MLILWRTRVGWFYVTHKQFVVTLGLLALVIGILKYL